MAKHFSFNFSFRVPPFWATLRWLVVGNQSYAEEAPVFADDPVLGRPFLPYYDEHIRPVVGRYEEARLLALKRMRRRSFFCIPAMLAAVTLTAYFWPDITSTMDPDDRGAVLIWPLVAAFALWMVMVWPAAGYMTQVKTEIFPLIFRFFGDSFTYDHKERREGKLLATATSTDRLSVTELVPSRILPDYDVGISEDHVYGSHREVSLELLEITLKNERRDSKGRKREDTIFHGMGVLLGMHKAFKGITILKRDLGWFNWAQGKEGLERVTLEDPEFEKLFQVYSNDQIEARYLLSPSMMERMLRLQEISGSKAVTASFYDHRLLILLEGNKNWFEGSHVFDAADFVKDINVILAEMKLMFEIIELLKLHEKLNL